MGYVPFAFRKENKQHQHKKTKNDNFMHFTQLLLKDCDLTMKKFYNLWLCSYNLCLIILLCFWLKIYFHINLVDEHFLAYIDLKALRVNQFITHLVTNLLYYLCFVSKILAFLLLWTKPIAKDFLFIITIFFDMTMAMRKVVIIN